MRIDLLIQSKRGRVPCDLKGAKDTMAKALDRVPGCGPGIRLVRNTRDPLTLHAAKREVHAT